MIVETEKDRQFRVDQALATLRLEGEAPSAQIVELMQGYVSGNLTLTNFQELAMTLVRADVADPLWPGD